jgi:hypothetical protein
MWDCHDQHIRWVVAAASSVVIGHAAMDIAIVNYPKQRFILRQGVRVIREHNPATLSRAGAALKP